MPALSYVFAVNPGRINSYKLLPPIPTAVLELKSLAATDLEVSVADPPNQTLVFRNNILHGTSIIVAPNVSLVFFNPNRQPKQGYVGAVT